MRRAINTCVRLFAESFGPSGPVLEVGSRHLPGYEQVCDVRRYFRGLDFVGTDIRPGLGVDRIEDAHALSCADDTIGTVLMFETLEHLVDPDRALAEAWRVLKDTGLLALSVPFTYRLHGFPADYWRFTASGVYAMLDKFPAKVVFALGPRLKPAFVFAVAAKGSTQETAAGFASAAARFRAAVLETFAQSRFRGYLSVLKERGRDFFGCLLGRAELTAAFFEPSPRGGDQQSACRPVDVLERSRATRDPNDKADFHVPHANLSGGVREQPLVSVCVPTYNDGEFLRQSLESIVRQSYSHLEILVSDDCSSDDTPAIVKSFVDSRIQYNRNPSNLGQFENVNRTLQRARGEFIAIYHSDDIYEPTIIEQEVSRLMSQADVGAVFTLNRRIDHFGRVLGRSWLPRGVPRNVALDLPTVVGVLLRNKNRLLCGPSFMGRAEVFRCVGNFDTHAFGIAADLEMWLRILTCFKVAIIDEPLMRYRKGTTQVSAHYNTLRTCEDHFFAIMDRCLQRSDVRAAVDSASLREYAFHRCDDETFRAANMIIRGNLAGAAELLRRPASYGSLFGTYSRRKLRVRLLRALLQTGITLGATRLLTRLVTWTEYGNLSLNAASSG